MLQKPSTGLTSLAMILTMLMLPAAASGEDESAFDRLEIYLMTVGTGWDVPSVGGHTMLRLKDPKTGWDRSYNWGIYDFSKPGFVSNYLKGVLDYTIQAGPTDRTIQWYKRTHLERAIWMERLNVTLKQKATILKRITWWQKEENRIYRYSMWNYNCATIVRDILDEALGGHVKKSMSELTGRTYRTSGWPYMSQWPWVLLLLDVGAGPFVDQPIDRWLESYLSVKLRDYMKDVTAVDDEGNPTGEKLLGETTVIHPGEKIERPLLAHTILAVIIWVLVFSFAAWRWKLKDQQEVPRVFWRCWGSAIIFLGLFAAGFGTGMLYSWGFTFHDYTYRNMNLLVFWPLDWLLVAAGIGMLVKGRMVWPRLLRIWCIAHLVLIAVWAILWLSGLYPQNVVYTFWYFAIPATLLYGSEIACHCSGRIMPAKNVKG